MPVPARPLYLALRHLAAVVETMAFLLLVVVVVVPASTIAQDWCSSPASGCKNGLWSAAACRCECVPPFCRDAIGACTVPSDNCGGNPWTNCVVGLDCPWWNDPDKREHCVTGWDVPPGTWDLHASREVCCNVEHPYSSACLPKETPVIEPPPAEPSYDDTYEVVPIKFSVSGLPEVVNMRDLKDEMLTVLKRALIDLTERVADLRISKVEENLVLTMESQNEGNDSNRREVYYDVTVIRDPNRQYGPIIIAGLQDDYEIILEKIQEYTTMTYLGYGIELTWCTDDSGGQAFGMCTDTNDKVTVGIRLANIPGELDMRKLMLRLIAVYQSILKDVEGLEIVGIEGTAVDVTATLEGDTKDVLLDITLVRHLGEDFEPAIRDRVQTSASVVLSNLQSYTDTETDLDLNWCINGEGAYAVCPLEEVESRFALPSWTIITLTVVSVVLACCVCYCTTAYMKYREESKNERNMAVYLQTGQNYSKHQKNSSVTIHPPVPQRVSFSDRRRPSVDRPRRTSVERLPPSHKQQRLHYHDTDSMQDYSEATPRKAHQLAREDTEYQLVNMPTFVFPSKDEGTRKRDRKSDTDFQLENMPSFVFPGGGDCPPQQIIVADETDEEMPKKPDPDGSVLP